jgi:hypothetical protein
LDLRYKFNHRGLNSIISLGLIGYYPLFDRDWIGKIQDRGVKNLTVKEKQRVHKVINKLKKTDGLDKKRTIFSSQSEEDQILFMKAFTDFIAGKKIDENMELH